MTARVVEVLPNGDLALEGVREIDINGDRQIIVLTGVVRTADIGPGNVVPSTAIGQMRIRYFGRGLIKDNLQPGLARPRAQQDFLEVMTQLHASRIFIARWPVAVASPACRADRAARRLGAAEGRRRRSRARRRRRSSATASSSA